MPCPGDPGPRPDFIPAADVAKLVMKYLIFNQQVHNVHYFSRSGGYDASALNDLVQAAKDSWLANFITLMSGEVTLMDITATDMSVEDGATSTVTVNTACTNAGAILQTIGNTLAVKFLTGLSGRSFRGRMYVPALFAANVNDGIVDTTLAGIWVDAITAFFDDILADTADQHVIVSYQNDCEWRDNAVVTPVQAYNYTDRFLDSQRRRLTGRGA